MRTQFSIIVLYFEALLYYFCSSIVVCSDEGLTLATVSQHTLYGVQHIHINIVRFTATPTQTKTSSHRD